MYDLRHITCGLVPRIQQLLSRAGAGQVEFLVQAKSVEAIVNSLGSVSAWELSVENRLDEGVVRFVRRSGGSDDDPLSRV